MSDVLKTVKVRRDGGRGFRIINKDSYDANPGAYQLFDETKAAPPKADDDKPDVESKLDDKPDVESKPGKPPKFAKRN